MLKKESATLYFSPFPFRGCKLFCFFLLAFSATFVFHCSDHNHLAIHYQSLEILSTSLISSRLFSHLFMVMSSSLREFTYCHYTGISRQSINQTGEILLALYSRKLLLLYLTNNTLMKWNCFYKNRKK